MKNWKMTALFLFYLCAGLFVSHRFPPVHSDEILACVTAQNLSDGRGARYSLSDDLLPETKEDQYGFALYPFWIAFWMAILPSGWGMARVSALAAGWALMVFSTKQLGPQATERDRLLCAGFFLASPLLWMNATVTGVLIILAAAMSGLIWIGNQDVEIFPGANILVGLTAGVLPLIHPFGWGGCASIVVSQAVFNRRQKQKKTILTALGACFGGLMSLMGNPLIHKSDLYLEIAKPPILSLTSFLEWVNHLSGFILKSTSFYYPGAEKYSWGLSQSYALTWLSLFFLVVAFLGLWIFKKVRDDQTASLVGGLIAMAVFLCMASARREGFYLILLMPFAGPAAVRIGGLLTANSKIMFRLFGYAFLATAFGALVVFGKFAVDLTALYPSHASVVRKLKLLTGDPKSIMAPSIYWFDYPSSDFRDAGALMTSRYFTNGEFEPKRVFEKWRPEVLVISQGVFKQLSRKGNVVQKLADELNVSIEVLGVVDAGYPNGEIVSLRLAWLNPLPLGTSANFPIKS